MIWDMGGVWIILVFIRGLCDLCFGFGGVVLGVLEKYENYAVISNFAVST